MKYLEFWIAPSLVPCCCCFQAIISVVWFEWWTMCQVPNISVNSSFNRTVWAISSFVLVSGHFSWYFLLYQVHYNEEFQWNSLIKSSLGDKSAINSKVFFFITKSNTYHKWNVFLGFAIDKPYMYSILTGQVFSSCTVYS